MLKLALCLITSLAVAVWVLNLRQRQLELGHQAAELHDRIKSRQSKLWDQQFQIAVFTAPNAITQTVNNRHMKMISEAPLPAGHGQWIDDHAADAE